MSRSATYECYFIETYLVLCVNLSMIKVIHIAKKMFDLVLVFTPIVLSLFWGHGFRVKNSNLMTFLPLLMVA